MLELANDLIDTPSKLLVDRSRSAINPLGNRHLENISRPCPTVGVLIYVVDWHASYQSFNMAHRAIERGNFLCLGNEAPDLDRIMMNCYKPVWVVVEESYVCAFLIQLITCGHKNLTLTFSHVPKYELVSILRATNWSQQPFIAREAQRLDHLLVKPHSVENVTRVEVPHDKGPRLLWAMLVLFTRCEYISLLGNRDIANLSRMTLQETIFFLIDGFYD